MTAPLDPDVLALEQIIVRLRHREDQPQRRSAYDVAKAMYRQRRERESLFGRGLALFGEPCWDMLLDLYIAHAEAKDVSISSVCIASVVPPSTALRSINTLLSSGLAARYADPTDRRRSFIRLTSLGFQLMERHLRAHAL